MRNIFLVAFLLCVAPYAWAGDIVAPTPDMQQCKQDSDCTLVGTGCDYCCQHNAVNKDSLKTYEAHKNEQCESYKGGVCNCAFCSGQDKPKAHCVKGQCQSGCEAP